MLDDIVLFVNLVEINSFTKAAEKLGVQPSTISKKINALEQKLGEVLLKRDTRNISLTDYGRLIYEKFSYLPHYVNGVIDTINLRFLVTESKSVDISGKLNIKLGNLISIERVLPKISIFTKLFPNVRLNIRIAHDYHKLQDDDDILLMQNGVNDPLWVSKFITTEYYKLFCTPSYAKKYGIPKTIEELNNHEIIGGIDDKTNEEREYVIAKNICTQQKLPIYSGGSQIKINSPLHAKEIGLGSEFIFYCWNGLCQEELCQQKIVPVLPEWYFYHLDYYVVYKKQSKYIEQMFVEFIHTCFSA